MGVMVTGAIVVNFTQIVPMMTFLVLVLVSYGLVGLAW